jgi:hypothetical protein
MSKKIIILSLLVLPLRAWSFFFEYQHLGEREQRELNSPRLIDSEYQSDKMTYELPLQWQYDWLNESKIFQYSAGSLGPTRFSTRGRMRLRENLNESLYFQLSFLDYGDFETDRQSFVFEFGYRLQSWLSLAIYGQPSSFKSEDDIGLATEIQFSSTNTLRLFHTWVDFSHNKRNEGTDFYQSQPGSVGAVWRWWSSAEDQEYMELALRHDFNTQRVFVDTPRVYSFEGTFINWMQRKKLGPGDYLQWQLEASSSFEGDTLNTDQGVERWDTRRLSFLVQHQNDDQWVSLYGIKKVHVHWESSQGHVIHNSLLPHFWVPFYRSHKDGLRHEWLVGLETTWHRGQGSQALRGINDFDRRFEHRFNLRYQLQINERAHLTVLGSLDLNDPIQSPWEGGNMQYTQYF